MRFGAQARGWRGDVLGDFAQAGEVLLHLDTRAAPGGGGAGWRQAGPARLRQQVFSAAQALHVQGIGPYCCLYGVSKGLAQGSFPADAVPDPPLRLIPQSVQLQEHPELSYGR